MKQTSLNLTKPHLYPADNEPNLSIPRTVSRQQDSSRTSSHNIVVLFVPPPGPPGQLPPHLRYPEQSAQTRYYLDMDSVEPECGGSGARGGDSGGLSGEDGGVNGGGSGREWPRGEGVGSGDGREAVGLAGGVVAAEERGGLPLLLVVAIVRGSGGEQGRRRWW